MINKKAGSWLQLLNPLSQVLPGDADRVPSWVTQLPFGSTENNFIALKTGACGLLAAALVGGGRLLQHINTVGKLREKDAPGRALASELNYSYELGTDTKQKKRNRLEDTAIGAVHDLVTQKTASLKKEALTFDTEEAPTTADTGKGSWMRESMSTVLPVGAMLLASGLAYKAVDDWANARKDRILSKRIDGKNRYLKQLLVARAQNAKSPLSQEELNAVTVRPDFEATPMQAKQGSLRKQAGDNGPSSDDPHGIKAGLGLSAAALLVASAIASYKYAEATDPENLKYKAYKKGLSEYAAQRSKSVPLTVRPADSALFDKIDSRASTATAAPVSDTRLLSL